jgi:hypothetical protein
MRSAHRRYRLMISSETKISACWKMVPASRLYQKKRGCAIRIQAWWRMLVARRLYRLQRASATVVDPFGEGVAPSKVKVTPLGRKRQSQVRKWQALSDKVVGHGAGFTRAVRNARELAAVRGGSGRCGFVCRCVRTAGHVTNNAHFAASWRASARGSPTFTPPSASASIMR